jgi:hypothetical protein
MALVSLANFNKEAQFRNIEVSAVRAVARTCHTAESAAASQPCLGLDIIDATGLAILHSSAFLELAPNQVLQNPSISHHFLQDFI